MTQRDIIYLINTEKDPEAVADKIMEKYFESLQSAVKHSMQPEQDCEIEQYKFALKYLESIAEKAPPASNELSGYVYAAEIAQKMLYLKDCIKTLTEKSHEQ